jgi:hypothetical protein
MDSLGLIAAFRTDVDDNAVPQLWSDASVAEYADDAQKMFCRLTNGISDSTSDLCSIDIEIGEPFADLDKRILKVRRMQRASDSRPIILVNFEDLDSCGLRLDATRGTVGNAVLGMDENKVRWSRVPAVADVAQLTVYRMPLRAITVAKTQLEIAEQHHRALLLWMKYLAYSRQDSDVYDPRAAAANEQKFRAYCMDAKFEQDRARSKVRVVRYGGI